MDTTAQVASFVDDAFRVEFDAGIAGRTIITLYESAPSKQQPYQTERAYFRFSTPASETRQR